MSQTHDQLLCAQFRWNDLAGRFRDALREELDELLAEVPAPCVVGLESTLFTAWVYDHLTAKGISVKVAHPAMLKGDLCGKAEE